jgi:hypothetical protein
MRTRRDPRARGGESGLAEVLIILTVAAILGFAFLWALVLHEKPPPGQEAEAFDPTASTLVPPTLPPPHKYKIVDGVNLRQGAATNTAVITRLEDGQKVIVICKTVGQDISTSAGSSNLWLRIDLGFFGTGYSSAVYVDTGDDIDDPNRIGDCAFAPAG